MNSLISEILRQNNIEADEGVISAINEEIGKNYVKKQDYDTMLMEGQLKAALVKSSAKSEKAILGFIDKNKLKLENGELTGLEGQLAEIKKAHGYLFEDTADSTGFNHSSGMNIDYDSLSDEEYYALKTERK